MPNPNDSIISNLPVAGALIGSEIFAAVQSGVTKQIDLDAITLKTINYIENNGIGGFTVSGELTAEKLISSLSGVQFPDGTVMTSAAAVATGMTSTGSLAFASNTDGVGIGDTIFSTNTVERMRILTAGNVGIGIANPLNDLHVKSKIRLSSSEIDTTNKTGFLLASQYDSTAEVEGYAIVYSYSDFGENVLSLGGGGASHNAATQVRLYTATNNTTRAGTEKMRITAAGLLGLGTTNPRNRLHILGQFRISGNETNNTDKDGSILGSHYADAESVGYVGMHLGANISDNITAIGGGRNGRDAATLVKFFTGATTTTNLGTMRMEIKSDGGIFAYNLKSGTTQGSAGAVTDELWVDTDDDNTIKLGV